MRRAALFVALGREEGFGLPVAEALASGCPVVGFHGMGGRELFGSEYAVAIEDGDVGALATWIERFVAEYDECRGEWERRGAEATDFVRSTYSRERATADLVACFGAIDAPSRGHFDARDCAGPSATERGRPRAETGSSARASIPEFAHVADPGRPSATTAS